MYIIYFKDNGPDTWSPPSQKWWYYFYELVNGSVLDFFK